MSRWTHITSCLSIDTCIEAEDIEATVREYLASAPKITGSEADADIFVNKQSGYNSWTNCDCEHCKYKDTIVDLEDGHFKCESEDGYKCPKGEYQTCVTISIQGDLRDRLPEQTEREFDILKQYIKEKYIIRDYSLNIEGE